MMTKKRAVKWLSLRSRGIKRKPPKICESSDCEDSEMVGPTVKRSLPKGFHTHTVSMED